jgi:short-subunit dehydrogenase
MKKALVLGASGGMGYALVNELTERGIETVAFARTKEKLQKLYHGKKNKRSFLMETRLVKTTCWKQRRKLTLFFMR